MNEAGIGIIVGVLVALAGQLDFEQQFRDRKQMARLECSRFEP